MWLVLLALFSPTASTLEGSFKPDIPYVYVWILFCTTSKHFPLCDCSHLLDWLYSSQVFPVDVPKPHQEPRKDNFRRQSARQSTNFSVSPMHPYTSSNHIFSLLITSNLKTHKNTDLPLENFELFRRKFERSPSTLIQNGCMVASKPREATPPMKKHSDLPMKAWVNMPKGQFGTIKTRSAAWRSKPEDGVKEISLEWLLSVDPLAPQPVASNGVE